VLRRCRLAGVAVEDRAQDRQFLPLNKQGMHGPLAK
jgi:hypothetical protein